MECSICGLEIPNISKPLGKGTYFRKGREYYHKLCYFKEFDYEYYKTIKNFEFNPNAQQDYEKLLEGRE